MYKKPTTSPKRQYIATAIFAILAIVSALGTTNRTNQLNAQTMSYTEQGTDNGHSQTIEELARDAYGSKR